MKTFKDISIIELKSIDNKIDIPYKNVHKCGEVTFLGSENQPDFAELTIEIMYDKSIIELKSLKKYLYQFRDIHISYERLGASIFKGITARYQPSQLKVQLKFNIRGGISSEVIFESNKELLNK
jgi:7-cyano-7-deazaguanine reductase